MHRYGDALKLLMPAPKWRLVASCNQRSAPLSQMPKTRPSQQGCNGRSVAGPGRGVREVAAESLAGTLSTTTTPSAAMSYPKPLNTEYPLIDADPHVKRVLSYMRPSDYAVWGTATIAAPAALNFWERIDPSKSAGVSLRNAGRLATVVGFVGGFLLAYQSSSRECAPATGRPNRMRHGRVRASKTRAQRTGPRSLSGRCQRNQARGRPAS